MNAAAYSTADFPLNIFRRCIKINLKVIKNLHMKTVINKHITSHIHGNT